MINVCQRIQDHTPQQHTDHAPQQPSHTHSIERVDHTLSSGAETEESGSRSATPDDEGLMNGCSQFRRCRSTDALSRFHSSKGWKTFQSASSEDEDGGGMEWSLGESIMKAMSQHGLTLFNIDNPTSARYRDHTHLPLFSFL
jgi:hypothetical protein